MSTEKPLVICDLDGTLVTTFQVHFKAYKTALNLKGFSLDEDTFRDFHAKKWDVFLAEVTDNASQDDIEAIHKSKLGFFHTFIEDAVLNERLVTMIRSMKDSCSLGLVTSCSRKNCDEILSHFKLDDLFEHVIAGDDVVRQKPDPEGYLMMMKYFSVGPDDTVIYEDSSHGIAAARASGAQVHVVQWDGK